VYPGTAQIFWVPPIIPGTGKATDLNFVGIFIGLIGTKDHKNVGNSSRGRSQGVPKIQGTHRAHRAVIFATAQLSCYVYCNRTLSSAGSWRSLLSSHSDVLLTLTSHSSDQIESQHRHNEVISESRRMRLSAVRTSANELKAGSVALFSAYLLSPPGVAKNPPLRASLDAACKNKRQRSLTSD